MKLTIHWLAWTGASGYCVPCDETGFITLEWKKMAVEFSLEELLQRIQPHFVDWPHPCFDILSLEVEL